jgi:hypothetical protein
MQGTRFDPLAGAIGPAPARLRSVVPMVQAVKRLWATSVQAPRRLSAADGPMRLCGGSSRGPSV